MHEQDALSVPPQWIPNDSDVDELLTFFNPSGTRAVVGSRAAEQTLPEHGELPDRGARAPRSSTSCSARSPATAWRVSVSAAAAACSLLYLGSRMLPGIALIVPLYLTIKTYGLLDNLGGADHDISDVHAAVHDLAAAKTTSRASRARWRRRHSWMAARGLQMLMKVLLPAAAAGAGRGRHVRVHDGVERLPVRRDPDEHDRLQDACPSWSPASRPT